MKMKSLAAVGMAGLMAASIVYVTPAMADDAADAAAMPNVAAMDQNSPTSSPDSSMQQDDSTTSDNVGSALNNGSTTTDNVGNSLNNDNSAPMPPADNSAASSDQGSPDTATGDDDY